MYIIKKLCFSNLVCELYILNVHVQAFQLVVVRVTTIILLWLPLYHHWKHCHFTRKSRERHCLLTWLSSLIVSS